MDQQTTSDAWAVEEDGFPKRGTLREQLAFAVRYALLAPSRHNVQPWLFRVRGETIELWADRARALPACDPEDRELTMACGVALQFLGLALRNFGWTFEVARLPDGPEGDLLARVTLSGHQPPTADEAALFRAIPRRHTAQAPFELRLLPEGLISAMEADARLEGARLSAYVTREERERVLRRVQEADRYQLADSRFRRELAAWLHPNRSRSLDGMPGAVLGLGYAGSLVGPALTRLIDAAPMATHRDRNFLESALFAAVLSTPSDAPGDWLNAGMALGRGLLRAASMGVSAAFHASASEVTTARSSLETDLGLSGEAQLVLSFGFAPEPAATHRRRLEDALVAD